MFTKVEKLAARRGELVLQAAHQRDLLSSACDQLGAPLQVADAVLNFAAFIKRKPWLITVVTALIGAFGFRKINLPGELSGVWKFARGAVKLWQKFKGL